MTSSELIHQILKKYWGYDQFRPLQEDIILSVLQGKDTMALLPTGGGKSICFQVPAMAMQGLCIVVSPLIALMKDQVANLKKKGIKASAIFSGMSHEQIRNTIDNCLFDKEMKFLYLSPERLKTELFRVNLERMPVCMFAIDEAHCISQWGYDFRPPYLEIAEIRPFFPQVPVLALTATATPEVVTDIQQKLLFSKENVFQKSFKRDNLTYYVIKEEDKLGRMLRIIQHHAGTGIIYVRNRRKTQETAEFLQRHHISADFYHAGLDSATRDRIQQEWMDGKTRIIVSTNAFGMGIDKPDVRFVIHIDIPDTLEGYFQEAGRGGRDLKPSIAVMLYDNSDLRDLNRNFEISFPPLPIIQQIYKDLCNDFNIGIGDGEGVEQTINISHFAASHHYNPVVVYNSIRLIEKTGVIQFSDGEYTPSKLMVLLNQADFDRLENDPLYQRALPFIQLLLRSYSGLFSHFVIIDENEIAQRAECNVQQVIEKLQYLHKHQYVDYHPHHTLPKILFLTNRIHEKNLFYDPSIYYKRKTVAAKRLDAVVKYVTHRTICRSQLLLSYFGEKHSTPCGKCDICRKKEIENISTSQFKQMADALLTAATQYKDLRTLIFNVSKNFDEEQLINVARQLIDEGKLKLK